MTLGSFDILGGKLSAMMRSPDPEPMLEYIAFPFTVVEDEFTLVLHNAQDLRELHAIYYPSVGGVSHYDITDASIIPIGGMLYVASYTVSVIFGNGHRRDPAKRVIILADRGGKTKAVCSMAFLQFSTQWLAENAPDQLRKVRKWAS